MASVAHLLRDAENIVDELQVRMALAEEQAIPKFVNARHIQKLYRGHVTRRHIDFLRRGATCIQKNWRGFLGRRIYRKRLKEKFEEMCADYYYAMATVIQKCWRGYWTRSNVFSYYKLKTWLAFVAQQNKLLKSLAEASQNRNNVVEMKQREDEAKEWIVYILFKLHHLLRTHQLSGIYSLPNTTELSEIEKMLRSLKYKDFMIFYNAYMNDVRQAKAKELPPFILQLCKYGAHYEREYYEHKKPVENYLLSKEVYKSQTPVLDMEMKETMKNNKLGLNKNYNRQKCEAEYESESTTI